MMVFAAVVSDAPRQTVEIDEELFPRIGEGDKEAFCELYELANGAVFAYALALLRRREDAEDAAQETFLKIRAAAHLYTPMGKPMAWILTITRNICMMKFRQNRHTSQTPLDEVKEDFDCGDIENREDRIVLETALRVLSEDDCRIVMLHAVSGMKHREIAELLGLPLSTVLSRYNRAIRKLRDELEGKL